MGRSAADLAADFGIPKQTLGQYLNGQRGKPSRLIANLLAFCGLNREEIFFSDPFDCPQGDNPDSPVYWAGLALEALRESVQRGLPEKEAEKIAAEIRAAVAPFVTD